MKPPVAHQLLEFDRSNETHCQALVATWNAACGSNLLISHKFANHNLQPNQGGVLAGRLALVDGAVAGVVLASTLHGEPEVAPPGLGWLDAIAVAPSFQRLQIGSTLLAWAESWLLNQGCRACMAGASLRPFAPGVPTELDTTAFFIQHGYGEDGAVWDVAANLATYQTPATTRKIDGVVRPAQRGDETALLDFLRREFPGRWRYEYEAFLRQAKNRISDHMLLWTERGVDGSCVLTFEDSQRPIERFFPYQLPRPWGQLGTVGVSADRRGRGYGAALVDAGLRRLHNNGVNGCVIDWTKIVDFYGKFGFTKYREYRQLSKVLV
jgi:predicted N-acetyltransferase YhbS